MRDELRSVGVSPVDVPKLKGNQNVRDTETGQFADETERFDPERVVETDEPKCNPSLVLSDVSPWLKHWIELGSLIEQAESDPDTEYNGALDTLAVNAVIHAQVLKRP